MNTVLIAKNELINKANELQSIFEMSEEQLYFALQGAMLDISTRALSKAMYEDKAKQTQIKSLTEHNQKLCDILNEKGDK